MNWHDLLSPARLFARVAKLYLGLLLLLLCATALGSVVVRVHFTSGGTLAALAVLGSLSLIAFLIREHRRGDGERRRSTGGAERTPIIPPEENRE